MEKEEGGLFNALLRPTEISYDSKLAAAGFCIVFNPIRRD